MKSDLPATRGANRTIDGRDGVEKPFDPLQRNRLCVPRRRTLHGRKTFIPEESLRCEGSLVRPEMNGVVSDYTHEHHPRDLEIVFGEFSRR